MTQHHSISLITLATVPEGELCEALMQVLKPMSEQLGTPVGLNLFDPDGEKSGEQWPDIKWSKARADASTTSP